MRIARLFGIDLVVDWSFLLIATLLTANVTAVFAHWHPAWALSSCVALGVVAMLAFFASLVAHELAHSLVATTLGMKVTNIRLFLFGGVSNIDREPPSALGELAMAIVGPLVSIGLGVGLILVSLLLVRDVSLAGMQKLGPAATLFVWLGPLNVGVGIFNLLPAFPLDGGRVLRALLWGLTRSYDKATRIAATLGQLLGWSLVLVGVLRFFGVAAPLGRGAADGVWMAFIGWFLASAAQESFRSLRVHEALDGIRVSQLMRRAGPLLSPDLRVRALVEDYLVGTGHDAFVVVADDGELAGLVTASDVARIDRRAWAETPIRAIMTPARALPIAAPDEPVEGALRRFGERGVDQLPVLADGTVVGVLDRRQLLRWLSLALAPARPLRPARN